MIPELVFHGGHVFTGARPSGGPPATAVAVRQGRIVAVGDDGLLELAGPATRTVDLAGRLLVPGFQDAHAHPVFGALELSSCHLGGLATVEEYLAAVAAYAASHPDDGTLQGAGWTQAAFPDGPPTAALLDRVVPDRPILLWGNDGHRAWVNSAALAAAGIDADTPDPADGRIERDAAGRPTGLLLEGAVGPVLALLPDATPGELDAAVLRAQEHLHAVGITAWQDAILSRAEDGEDPAEAYLRADRAGRLTARVTGALWWDRTRGLEQIPELVERRERFRGTRFSTPTVKIMQDGIIESETAALLAPYRAAHAETGLSFVDPELLREIAVRLEAEGFQLHFHGIGDRAVRESLDAIAAARGARRGADPRHHIAHVQLIDPLDVPRFAELGVTANIQPYWACNDPLMVEHTVPLLGDERAGQQYPFGALHAAGARLAAGSDWPVSTPDPIAGIHVAVTRTLPAGHPGRSTEPFLPEQAIDVATALEAYTAGSAHVNRLDDTGRIAPGYAADLAVLDRNLLAIPAEEIGATRVDATFVDGAPVFER
ncbi:amidohydrolase family protein [Agromyces mediolanus]|uniref:amidohydrolase n=1 Tax=Agromyces mediolanus TaxID=41986 RepID=UPI003838FA84